MPAPEVVGGIGGGTSEKAYSQAAVRIRKGEIKTTSELLAAVSGTVPSDEEFRSSFATARVPRNKLARYYLLALERHQSGDSEPELVPNSNEDEVNLEHVLPKKATAVDWGSEFDEEERKAFLYRLGNLALLQKGPNGRICNRPFSYKRPILSQSRLALTSEIGTSGSWTKEAISERQARMANLAVKTWPRS